MTSVAVLSSVYGSYDQLTDPPEQTLNAEWICISDQTQESDTWSTVVEPRSHMHPRLAAKVAKCRPDLYTDADVTVWVDGSFRFLTDHTLADLVSAAGGHPISQLNHPWRQCIYKEAEASIGMPKYEGQSIQAQVDHYRGQKYPERHGLWATGLIVRNHIMMTGTLAQLGDEWLHEQVRWTYQDQLSEAVVLQRWGLRPHILPWPLHGSGLFEWHNHASDL